MDLYQEVSIKLKSSRFLWLFIRYLSIVNDSNKITDPAEITTSWVTLYSDHLFSWAYHKTSNKEVAEDLVQDTFLAAFRSIDKFEHKSQPKTWLLSILRNKINDYYRSQYKLPQVSHEGLFDLLFDNTEHWRDEEAPKEWADEDEGHLLDDSEFQHQLHNCLKKLPENWFAAIHLKFIQEKKGNEICQELDITDTNFWQILHRAKLQLRKCLALNWFEK